MVPPRVGAGIGHGGTPPEGRGKLYIQVASGSRRAKRAAPRKSVPHAAGKHVDDDHAGDDEAEAEEGGKVQRLLEDEDADKRAEEDAEPAPDGVGDADGPAGQRDRKKG